MSINVKKILVPVDFSSVSQDSLEYAAAMAEKFSAEILILNVVEESGNWSVGLGDPVHVKERWEQEEAQKSREELEKLSSVLPENVTCTIKVYSGDVSGNIISCIQTERCDLLIMGAHGSSGVLSDWLGGVAYKVSKKAPCPVLMVRHQG